MNKITWLKEWLGEIIAIAAYSMWILFVEISFFQKNVWESVISGILLEIIGILGILATSFHTRLGHDNKKQKDEDDDEPPIIFIPPVL